MRSLRTWLELAMCIGDAQDAQDDAVRAPASGRNFFFCDVDHYQPGIWIIISQASGSLSAGYYHHPNHYQPGIWIIISRELSSSGSLSAGHPGHYQPGIINFIWSLFRQASGHCLPGIWSLLARHLVIYCQVSCVINVVGNHAHFTGVRSETKGYI